MLRLTIPIAAGTMCTALLTLSDTIMAGWAGSADLAGVAAGGALFFPTLMFLQGLISAYSARLGRLSGARQEEQIAATCHAALSAAVGCAVALLSILLILALFVIHLDADPMMGRHFKYYLIFVALALPDAALLFILKASCEALGAARLSFYCGLWLLLSNIPLNFLCIFTLGLGGFGCGVGTLLSISTTTAILLLYLRRHCPPLYRQLNLMGYSFKGHEVKAFLKEGLPLGLAAAVESSAFALIALLLSPLGPVTTAGHSIAMCLNSLIFVCPLSIGIAACIKGAQALGAQDRALYLRQLKALLTLSALTLILTESLTLIGKDYLPQLFTADKAVAALASSLLNFVLFNQIFEHLQCVLSFQLRAFKAGRVVLLVTILCFYVIALPVGALLCFGILGPTLQAQGFWLSLALALPLAFSCYALTLWHKLRRGFNPALEA